MASFTMSGYRAAHVSGDTPALERDALIAGLGTGAIEVLTSCALIDECLDVPSIGVVILLRPTKSLVLHRQQIGCGIRTAAGKVALVVLDHAANTLVHGLPTDEPSWTLASVDGPKADAPPPVWTCHECGQVNAISNAVCNFGEPGRVVRRDPPQATPGELAEVTAQRLAAVRRMSYRQVLASRLFEAELRSFARARGYRRGWVQHRLREQAEP
jgi:DNA repair protein RadD